MYGFFYGPIVPEINYSILFYSILFYSILFYNNKNQHNLSHGLTTDLATN